MVVDAAQGVEAQSVANCYTALEQGLEVLPVINKIDLPSADPAKVIHEIEEIIGIPADDAALVSAKTGLGVTELLEQLVKRIPPPKGDPDGPLQALIIDSWFDNYVGVVSLVRVMNGALSSGAKIRVMSTGRSHVVDKLGRFAPKPVTRESLDTGEVGLRGRGHQGDRRRAGRRHHHAGGEPGQARPLAGFKQVQPRVFAGLFPGELGRLRAVSRRAEEAQAQRFGAALRARGVHRAGLRIPLRLPGAAAHGDRAGAARARIRSRPHHQRADRGLRGAADRRLGRSTSTIPTKLPPQDRIAELREPIITANILVPPDHVGAVLTLCSEKRGVQKKMLFLGSQVSLQYRVAAGRGGARFLRSAEVGEPRLCLVRLRISFLPGGAAGQARRADQRRSGRCAVADRAPGQFLCTAAGNSSTRCRN